MELPYCKSWLLELLDEGHGPLGLHERLTRAGFRVETCVVAELAGPPSVDLIVQAQVGYFMGGQHCEASGTSSTRFDRETTMEDVYLQAIENAAVRLFTLHSALCQMCINGEHLAL